MGLLLHGALGIANIIISLFVLCFAIVFLKKTVKVKDRNPWIFLLIAVVVFFAIEVLKIASFVGWINLHAYSFYLDSMFIAILLFTFIFQYNLILNSELIAIRRKKKRTTSKKNSSAKKKS
ncbi:MAG: hypothetical protein ACQESC_02770 [Nanobdellota archaeon]